MITMENVCKSYKVAKRDAGFIEACKSLFHKEYEYIHALTDVSFTIDDGEMVGYIGPNGAGKSSTIKILSGILIPESGSCCVNGLVPWKNRIEYVKDIGVVFGQRSQLWWDVPVIDSFALLKDIYSIPDQLYKSNLDELITMLELSEIIRTPAIFMLIGGTALFTGIFLIYAGLCFFTLEGLEFINILTDGIREHGKYPLDIYGNKVFKFCTYVIPYTLVQYYPLMYLLDRKTSKGYVFLPLLAVVFLIPSYAFWRFGVRHYKSSGS